MNSNVTELKRIVHGKVLDPTSTRDLTGLTPEGVFHLSVAFIQLIQMADLLNSLDEPGKAQLIQYGQDHLPDTLPDELLQAKVEFEKVPVKDQLAQIQELATFLKTLLNRYVAQGFQPNWTDMTGEEFAHLISGLQNGIGAAMTYAHTPEPQRSECLGRVREIAIANGVAAEFFGQYDSLDDFLKDHLDALHYHLAVANVPYGEEEV
ncbi:MAG: hypothetical protein H6581_20690 [Bacteroidia bacterium]|nr:hypothetical protein [Bacteroidia bacterium]